MFSKHHKSSLGGNKLKWSRLLQFSLVATVGSSLLLSGLSYAEKDDSISNRRRKDAPQGSAASLQAPVAQGKAVTTTEVVVDKAQTPMLTADSAAQMQSALTHYEQIVSSGGWPQVPNGTYRKGSSNKNVGLLNKRLRVEGYLVSEGGDTFSAATQEAVSRFQRNNGLFVSGGVDGPTLKALNVSAEQRLATIRANVARVQEYSQNLGPRYLVVNVPAQQIETVENGRVYSRHNAIVGRPERPTPVVMTPLTEVAFNPYWNAPPSIIERDVLPRIKNGDTSVLRKMKIHVFKGVGGPEVDPDTLDWKTIVVDDYHFRQDPGPESAMATAKINFNSPFGIYLHDTPERHLFGVGGRFFSSGCVRVDKMPIMLNWVLNGQDGYNSARIAEMADTLDRVDVKLVNPPQLRVAYLTAWPVGNGIAAFRNDIYNMDGTGFVVGQPMPVGETSPDGQRYVLKPIPRLTAAIDGDGNDGFSWFGGKNKKSDQPAAQDMSDKEPTTLTSGNGKTVVKNGSAFARDKDKPKQRGLFDWASYRAAQKNDADRMDKKPGSAKIVKANKTADSTAKSADTKLMDAKTKDGKPAAKKPVKDAKAVTGQTAKSDKLAKAAPDAAAKEKPTPSSDKAVKPVAKAGAADKTSEEKLPATDKANDKAKVAAKAPAASAKKPAAKVADACKPDGAGKLPEGCKPSVEAKPDKAIAN